MIKILYNKINNEKYYPYYILILSSIVLFFQLEGSIGNWDEACYSQIAKEGITSGNWLNLNYLGRLWFEKPPLVIWLTMISYKLFGINEFATWFFPVIFGIFGVLGVYYLSKLLFNAKVGLLSSLVLLSTPHYLLLARNNMMDIFVFTFSLYAFIFLIKSKTSPKYILLSGILLGLSFMSKNVISILIILPAVIYYLFFINSLNIARNRYLKSSIFLFLLIIIPWHFIMTYRYQWNFLDIYINHHLFERFTNNIVTMEGSSDIFHYLKVIILRSGSWWFVFLVGLPVIFKNLKNKAHHKELLLLLAWGLFIIIFFTASVTKIHHYILPFYIPMSILVSFVLYDLYKKNSIYLIFPLLLIFLNINNSTFLRLSNFGESMLIFPKILYKIFNNSTIIVFIFTIILFAIVLYAILSKKRMLASKLAIIFIFSFSILLPIKPDRSPLAKEIGHIAKNNSIETIYYLNHDDSNIRSSLLYYNYPIKIIEIRKSMQTEFKFRTDSLSYCLENKKSKYTKEKGLEYDFYPCEIVK